MTKEQFIEDYNSMTNKQLAKKYKVSEMTIYRKAKKLNKAFDMMCTHYNNLQNHKKYT